MKNAYCLTGSTARSRFRAQMRFKGAVAVQTWDRQEVEQGPGDLEKAQKRHPCPEHQVVRVEQQPGDHQQQHREHHVHERAGQADDRLLPVRHERSPHPHRAAGKADPAQQGDQHRKAKRQQWIRVLQRVQRQIAAHRDVLLAESPGGDGVAELVQAQRHDPAGDDEDEHTGIRDRRTTGLGHPGKHRADRGHRDDEQEDGAGPHRLVRRTDGHLTKLPARPVTARQLGREFPEPSGDLRVACLFQPLGHARLAELFEDRRDIRP